MAHLGRREAQLGTDLAQGPTLGVQVGCPLCRRHRNESQPDRFTQSTVLPTARSRTLLRSDAVQRIGMPSRTSVHDRGRYPLDSNLQGRIAVMSSDALEFDVALSFAGEDRSLVEKVPKYYATQTFDSSMTNIS